MNNLKLYVILAQLCGYTGIGVILGYILGNGSSRTAIWVSGILIFISAIFIGMALASRMPDKNINADDTTSDVKQKSKKSSRKKK